MTIREDLACEPKEAYLWYDEETGGATTGWRWAQALGSTIALWLFDVDGKTIWIDSQTFKGAGPEVGREIQEIVDSITFE